MHAQSSFAQEVGGVALGHVATTAPPVSPAIAMAQVIREERQATERAQAAARTAELEAAGRPAGASSSEVAAPRSSSHVSRHRRVFKEVGAVTGITFIDHPKGSDKGVVVSELTPDGACATSGLRVGDHVSKINGERPTSSEHAVTLCDAAWIADADGTDKNKDRLKFSLHLRTQDFAIGKPPSGLAAGALVEVAVLGARKSSSKKLDDAGLVLEDSPAGYGALILSVAPDSPAHVAGLEAGLTIVSVDEVLVQDAASAYKKIDHARTKKGSAGVVCHLKKEKTEADHV